MHKGRPFTFDADTNDNLLVVPSSHSGLGINGLFIADLC